MKKFLALMMVTLMVLVSISGLVMAQENRVLLQTNGVAIESTEGNRVFFLGTNGFGFGYRYEGTEVNLLGNIGINVDGLFLSGYVLKDIQQSLELRLGAVANTSELRFVGGIAYQF